MKQAQNRFVFNTKLHKVYESRHVYTWKYFKAKKLTIFFKSVMKKNCGDNTWPCILFFCWMVCEQSIFYWIIWQCQSEIITLSSLGSAIIVLLYCCCCQYFAFGAIQIIRYNFWLILGPLPVHVTFGALQPSPSPMWRHI